MFDSKQNVCTVIYKLVHFSLISPHLTIHGHFINLCGVVLFNIAQNPDVLVLHEVDGNTLPAKTTRATDPVKRKCPLLVITKTKKQSSHTPKKDRRVHQTSTQVLNIAAVLAY